jgi:hypothetical protein
MMLQDRLLSSSLLISVSQLNKWLGVVHSHTWINAYMCQMQKYHTVSFNNWVKGTWNWPDPLSQTRRHQHHIHILQHNALPRGTLGLLHLQKL